MVPSTAALQFGMKHWPPCRHAIWHGSCGLSTLDVCRSMGLLLLSGAGRQFPCLIPLQALEAAMAGDEDAVSAFLAVASAREAKLRHRAVRAALIGSCTGC